MRAVACVRNLAPHYSRGHINRKMWATTFCHHKRLDAASHGNKDSPFVTPPGLNPQRLSPAVGVALDLPDGSGTKSLRSSFSHIEMESKSPLGATSQGDNIYQPGLITKAEGQPPFPSVTLQKTASFFLDFRVQPHTRLNTSPRFRF